VQKYISDITEDLVKIRDYTYSSATQIEERLRSEMDEQQMTISALYIQKGEFQLKL
jgi:hypothetical protein